MRGGHGAVPVQGEGHLEHRRVRVLRVGVGAEGEVGGGVEDQLALVVLDGLQRVGAVPVDQVGPRVDELLAPLPLVLIDGVAVLGAPVDAGDDEAAALLLQLRDAGHVGVHLVCENRVGDADDAHPNALQLRLVDVLIPEVADALRLQRGDGVQPPVIAEVLGVVVDDVAHVHVAQPEHRREGRVGAQAHGLVGGGLPAGEAALAVGDGQVVPGKELREQAEGVVQPRLADLVAVAALVAPVLVLLPHGAVPDKGDGHGLRRPLRPGQPRGQKHRRRQQQQRGTVHKPHETASGLVHRTQHPFPPGPSSPGLFPLSILSSARRAVNRGGRVFSALDRDMGMVV